MEKPGRSGSKAKRKMSDVYRFIVVNKIAKKDAYSLPFMETMLRKLRKAKFITELDLLLAYYQIPLAKISREITTSTVPGRGLWHLSWFCCSEIKYLGFVVNEHGLMVDPEKKPEVSGTIQGLNH